MKCGICGDNFEESEMTTVTPSQYLGGEYPTATSFCPICFRRFLIKAQTIYETEENTKKQNLKDFVNS